MVSGKVASKLPDEPVIVVIRWVCVLWCRMTCQLSAEPGSGPSSVSIPPPLKGTVLPGATTTPFAGLAIVAVGALFPTVRVTEACEDAASGSLTVSVATNFCTPEAVYWCKGFGVVELWPSPKFHRYDNVSPSGSMLPALEKLTVSGERPEVGEALAFATGERFAVPV